MWLKQENVAQVEEIITPWKEIVNLRSKWGPPVHSEPGKESYRILQKYGAHWPNVNFDLVWLNILNRLEKSLAELLASLDKM